MEKLYQGENTDEELIAGQASDAEGGEPDPADRSNRPRHRYLSPARREEFGGFAGRDNRRAFLDHEIVTVFLTAATAMSTAAITAAVATATMPAIPITAPVPAAVAAMQAAIAAIAATPAAIISAAPAEGE